MNGSGYSFGAPNTAIPETRNMVAIPDAPSGYTRVAGIHTHPNIQYADNENFSEIHPITSCL